MKLRERVWRAVAGMGQVALVLGVLAAGFSLIRGSVFALTRRRPVEGRPDERAEDSFSEEERRQLILNHSQREFTPDGTVFFTRHERRPTPGIAVYDAQLNRVDARGDYPIGQDYKRDWLPFDIDWVQTNAFPYAGDFRWAAACQPDFRRSMEIPVFADRKVKEVWRYLTAAGVWVGYETRGARIGFLGRDGFSRSLAASRPLGEFQLFGGHWLDDVSNSPLTWCTEDAVYRIDLVEREVDCLARERGSSIRHLDHRNWFRWRDRTPGGEKEGTPVLQVSFENGAVHLLQQDPDRRIVVRTGPGEARVRFAATEQGVFCHRQIGRPHWPRWPYRKEQWRVWYEDAHSKPWPVRDLLCRVHDDGSLEEIGRFEWTFRFVPDTRFARNPYDRAAVAPLRWRRVVFAFSPPLFPLVAKILAPVERRATPLRRTLGHAQWTDYGAIVRLVRHLKAHRFSWWGAPLIGVWMLLFWRHARARGLGRACLVAWAAAVVLLNLMGLLAYFALHHTRLVPCPSCGAKRPVDARDCARCGEPLAEPDPRQQCVGVCTA